MRTFIIDYSSGTQPLRMSKDNRGVSKKTVPQTRFKAITKSYSKEECFAVLKDLLPSSSQKQSVSEVNYKLTCWPSSVTLAYLSVRQAIASVA